jgi:hypothetical protein
VDEAKTRRSCVARLLQKANGYQAETSFRGDAVRSVRACQDWHIAWGVKTKSLITRRRWPHEAESEYMPVGRSLIERLEYVGELVPGLVRRAAQDHGVAGRAQRRTAIQQLRISNR